ncbi:hypothetical protein K3495_g11743 [Podosphaera aphanis]|nr:hypothetical protein K3495_g11743 [Podosphaera aphanis]
MALSMHSHSGQFCPGHAQNSLEECLQAAISRGFETFALTEHMPRDSHQDLYPEEVLSKESIDSLLSRHTAFLTEALSLRTKFQSKINVLIGFETEWIRPSYGGLINKLASNPNIDYFVGSVHHVHEIPIDYDAEFYVRARDISGGTDARLFEDYFDAQHEMLLAVRPRVVGHFDLIRLYSGRRDASLREMEGVWKRVLRNLSLVVEIGSLLEVNSSGLRKGLKEPYPMRCVCEAFLGMGGKLTLSDDSHGIAQVGACYPEAINYVESLNVNEIWSFDRKTSRNKLMPKSIPVQDIKDSLK